MIGYALLSVQPDRPILRYRYDTARHNEERVSEWSLDYDMLGYITRIVFCMLERRTASTVFAKVSVGLISSHGSGLGYMTL